MCGTHLYLAIFILYIPERSTQQFYQSYKSKSNHTDLVSLYITPDWDITGTKQIEPTGEQAITTDPKRIVEELTNYYSHIFQEKPSTETKTFLEMLHKRGITKKQRDHLEKDITILEVQRAIRSMAENEATGPDGIPA